MTSLETAKMAVKALDSKKALDIKVIKIQDISAIADYFVIATGTSSTHVKALADEVEAQLDEAGISVSHVEGYRSNSWILLDYVDVVVHYYFVSGGHEGCTGASGLSNQRGGNYREIFS